MNKAITIYGTITSPYVNRVVLACRRKKLPFNLWLPEGGSKSKEVLSINPLGKIPTIRDGKTVLFESSVILEYLDSKHPKYRLISSNVDLAAKTRLISAMWENYVVVMLIRLFVQAINKKPDKKIVSDSIEKLDAGLQAIEGFINPGPYAFGKSFTLADCYGVSGIIFLNRVSGMIDCGKLLKNKKNIKKYWSHIAKEPIVYDTIKDIKNFQR